MNAKGFLALLVLASLVGCSSRYQYQMDQSLLLQENQRLENALYVTHTQLAHTKRENDRLKTMLGQPSGNMVPRRVRPMGPAPTEHYDEAPLYESPKVSIPQTSPSNIPPDLLKGSALPPKTKVAATPPKKETAYFPPTTTEPEKKQEPPTEFALPEWTPNR